MASKRILQYGVRRVKGTRWYSALPEGKSSTSQQLINTVLTITIQFQWYFLMQEDHPYGIPKGHCHPKITKALIEQTQKLTLSSRAFYNDIFPLFAERITSMFGYDMVLPMNTGAEGVETALKLARKWGYGKKKIPKSEANIVSCCGCFHGRTLGVISMSCDNEATRGFGPLLPGHIKVDFGDVLALENLFKEKGDYIAGFLFEPIQGEAVVLQNKGATHFFFSSLFQSSIRVSYSIGAVTTHIIGKGNCLCDRL